MSRALLRALALALALLAAEAPRRAAAQFGGADVPPEVAVRWSALDPKKWNFTQLKEAMPLVRGNGDGAGDGDDDGRSGGEQRV